MNAWWRALLIALSSGVLALSAACGGSSTSSPTATRVATNAPTALTTAVASSATASGPGGASSSAGAGGNRGSFAATGSVSGTMSFRAVSCASAAGQRSVSLSGPIGNVTYGVTLQGQGTGSFNYASGVSQGSVPLVRFSDQTPGAASKTWSAGFQQEPGAGSVTINADNSGSLDLDLNPSTGATGNVHLKGNWTCS